MAQLLVRNLEDELVRDLKKRAGEHGVSVEEEHRRILREALRADAAGKRKSCLAFFHSQFIRLPPHELAPLMG